MYHVLEPIVVQSYMSRVIALIYAAMERGGYLADRNAAGASQWNYSHEIIVGSSQRTSVLQNSNTQS
jgi:hypothetical protein